MPVQPGTAITISGPDDVEISPKDKVPGPFRHLSDGSGQEISDTLFNIVEKRTPETRTTGRVRKKSKGVVTNTMPTNLYHHPDANDVQKDSVDDEVEATVAQVGGVAGEEDELEVIWLDVSNISLPKISIQPKHHSGNYNSSSLGWLDLIAPCLVLMAADVYWVRGLVHV
jgi:hypothetical protein